MNKNFLMGIVGSVVGAICLIVGYHMGREIAFAEIYGEEADECDDDLADSDIWENED